MPWKTSSLTDHGNAVLSRNSNNDGRRRRRRNLNSMKPDEQRRITGPPAIDAVGVNVSSLHIELGLVNCALKKGFLAWIGVRLAQITPDRMAAQRSNFLVNKIRIGSLNDQVCELKSSKSETRKRKNEIIESFKSEINNTRMYGFQLT